MKILFNDKQRLFGPVAVAKTESKALASFAKFGNNVKGIEITVQDVNGPRGGVDMACRVLVKLSKLKDVTVNSKDETLSKAVSNAINRAERSVARQVERRALRDGGRISRLSYEL